MSSRLRLIALTALVVGLMLRTGPLLRDANRPLTTCDGRAYHALGVAWANGDGLTIDDPDLIASCEGHLQPGPSHHYAPALPLIEGAFVKVLGDTPLALVLPLLLLSGGAVVAVWFTTRDLYGTDAGLLAAAAVSLEWTGVFFGTASGYSENLVLIALTLTLWAVFRGLRDDRFMLLAGAFAALGYLSKASIGWFFLVAGVGGVIYRLIFRGWRALTNRWYWAAIGIFAVPVVIWSYRNISLFWDGTPLGLVDAWQTSAINGEIVAHALARPDLLAIGLGGKLPVLAGLLFLPFAPLARGFGEPLRRWRDEDAFGLWMTVALIFVLGWFFAAVFWVYDQTSILWADPLRYVMPAQVPLLWLLLRQGPPSTVGWTFSFVILFLMAWLMPVLVAPSFLLGP